MPVSVVSTPRVRRSTIAAQSVGLDRIGSVNVSLLVQLRWEVTTGTSHTQVWRIRPTSSSMRPFPYGNL